MTVFCFKPPVHQRIGGLEIAIARLSSYLASSGITVANETDFNRNRSCPDGVVHFHGLWQPDFLRTALRCRRRRTPYLVSPHGMLEPWALNHKRWKKWPYFLLLERHFLRGASALLATSDLEAANLRRLFPHARIVVIPLGLTGSCGPDYQRARRIHGWESGERILLFLSRIHPKKGLDLLLRALADCRVQEQHLRLVIVGGGDRSWLNHLRALADQLRGHLPRIDWIGEVWGGPKWSYLQGADLFCLPSFSENFGLAILEALQVGTRVMVTSKCPWDFLQDWNAGFRVEPFLSDISRGLRRFLAEPVWLESSRALLAERIRQRFGWNVVGPQYTQLYQSLTQSRGQQFMPILTKGLEPQGHSPGEPRSECEETIPSRAR